MRDEPVHKPKAVVFGPTIVYDAERCIVCTRCVRVSEELAKDPVLSVRERGNLNEITVSPGRQLDHKYTLMTEYVCPVGALTSSDFRFKARVWFLRSARTVCVGCATGCNSFTDFDPRSQTVHRYRPRENLAVNKYWMCDDGMLDYQRIHQNRILEARVGGETTTREAATAKAAEILKRADPASLAVVLSAEHSQEDNAALLWLARDVLHAAAVFESGRPDGEGDQILRDADKNPNQAGIFELVAPSAPKSFDDYLKAAADGGVKTVLALGSQSPDPAKPLPSGIELVAISTHEGPWAARAKVVLPASSWAESDGTFVNAKGLRQQSEKAIEPRGDSRPAYRLVADLARALGTAPSWRRLSELQSAFAIHRTPSGAPAPTAGATS
jgi:NADH-quinone oxidoreductase subunit G